MVLTGRFRLSHFSLGRVWSGLAGLGFGGSRHGTAWHGIGGMVGEASWRLSSSILGICFSSPYVSPFLFLPLIFVCFGFCPLASVILFFFHSHNTFT